MKKYRLILMLTGLMLFIPGCGFDTGGEEAVVEVVHATPTPTPSPTPEVTPTPEATPTPEPVIEQTASGVNVEKKQGTYTAVTDVNLRADCSADAQWIASVTAGTSLNSTGVCDNGWVEIDYNGQVCYASGDYVTPAAADGSAADAAGAEGAPAEGEAAPAQ